MMRRIYLGLRDKEDLEFRKFKTERTKSWVSIVLTFVTIFSVLIASGIQLSDHLVDLKERDRFKYEQDFLTLVTEVNSGNPQQLKKSVILLANYGEKSFPFLHSLIADSDDLNPLITSFKIIKQNYPADSRGFWEETLEFFKNNQDDSPDIQKKVFQEIFLKSKDFILFELQQVKPSMKGIKNHLKVLGNLTWDKNSFLNDFLKEIKKEVESHKGVKPVDRHIFRELANKICMRNMGLNCLIFLEAS